jgi:hypothetical protein
MRTFEQDEIGERAKDRALGRWCSFGSERRPASVVRIRVVGVTRVALSASVIFVVVGSDEVVEVAVVAATPLLLARMLGAAIDGTAALWWSSSAICVKGERQLAS